MCFQIILLSLSLTRISFVHDMLKRYKGWRESVGDNRTLTHEMFKCNEWPITLYTKDLLLLFVIHLKYSKTSSTMYHSTDDHPSDPLLFSLFQSTVNLVKHLIQTIRESRFIFSNYSFKIKWPLFVTTNEEYNTTVFLVDRHYSDNTSTYTKKINNSNLKER